MTLTLPGVAGAILTIGMAADANVVVFERIKEEVRHGKTVRSAVSSGFKRGFLTIDQPAGGRRSRRWARRTSARVSRAQ